MRYIFSFSMARFSPFFSTNEVNFEKATSLCFLLKRFLFSFVFMNVCFTKSFPEDCKNEWCLLLVKKYFSPSHKIQEFCDLSVPKQFVYLFAIFFFVTISDHEGSFKIQVKSIICHQWQDESHPKQIWSNTYSQI